LLLTTLGTSSKLFNENLRHVDSLRFLSNFKNPVTFAVDGSNLHGFIEKRSGNATTKKSVQAVLAFVIY